MSIKKLLGKIIRKDYRKSFFDKYYYIKNHDNIKSNIYKYKL